MTRLTRAALDLTAILALACSGCGGDGSTGGKADEVADRGTFEQVDLRQTKSDAGVAPAGEAGATKPGVEAGNAPKADAGTQPPPLPAAPGHVCVKGAAACPTGETCVYLDMAAAKGTCMKSCATNADCKLAGTSYSDMCLEYTWWENNPKNPQTIHVCAFLCSYQSTTYTCPANHTCKMLFGQFNTCVPN